MLFTVMEGPGGGAAERIRGIDFAVGSLTTQGSGGSVQGSVFSMDIEVEEEH